MAVTGVILFLFVVAHLLGNLKIFEGPAAFNAYAEGLRTVGAPFAMSTTWTRSNGRMPAAASSSLSMVMLPS